MCRNWLNEAAEYLQAANLVGVDNVDCGFGLCGKLCFRLKWSGTLFFSQSGPNMALLSHSDEQNGTLLSFAPIWQRGLVLKRPFICILLSQGGVIPKRSKLDLWELKALFSWLLFWLEFANLKAPKFKRFVKRDLVIQLLFLVLNFGSKIFQTWIKKSI